jgi:hypothetical protein
VAAEPGFVAIDPKTRRIAFARENRVAEPTLRRRVMLPNFCAWQLALRPKDMTLFLANEEESHGGLILSAADPYKLQIVHRQPMASYVYTVALWGDHAYFGQNYHLGVVDAKVPSEARLVCEPFQHWDNAGQRCQRMAADRGYLYTTSGSTLVWDLSEPDCPTPVANLPDFAHDVAGFRESTGFFLYGNTLRIVDLASPAKPRIVHELKLAAGIGSARICGNYAFLSQGGSIHIYDVRDSQRPALVATTPCLEGFTIDRMTMFSCAVESGPDGSPSRLYQAYGRRNGAQTIVCYDLSRITAPTQVSRFEPPMISNRGRVILHDCVAHQGFLFTSSNGFGVLAIDYRDPAKPREAGYAMTSGELRGMKLLGDRLCAFGMALFLIPNFPVAQADIEGVGWHATSWFGGPVWGNAKTGAKVVMASSVHGGFQAHDISNPAAPKLDDRWPNGINGLWIGDLLCTVSPGPQRTLCLRLDDTRAGAPAQMAMLDLELTGQASLARYGHILFVCAQGGKGGDSVVVDITDPKRPEILSRFQVPGEWIILVSDIDFKFPYLFVPRKAVGVNVVDMSDPRRPKTLPAIAPIHHDVAQRNLEWADSVYVWGDKLYVGDYRTGMKVLNVADVRSPRFEHHYVDPMWANYSYSVCVDGYGRYVYNGGLGLVDFIEVSTPSEAPAGKVTATLMK